MKITKLVLTATAGITAMALAGCDAGDEGGVMDEVAENVPGIESDEGYPVGAELTADQQANFDAMDRQAVSDEYDENADVIRVEAEDTSATASGGNAADTMATGSQDPMSGSGEGSDDAGAESASSDGNTGMPPRSEMDFAWLDRNDDGKLSVAEYAIWAIPVDPTEAKPNDSTKPYLTQDQINEAGQTFYYFDEDGSTYLSESEFAAARNSARTP